MSVLRDGAISTSYDFLLKLKRLSDNLTSDDLQNLKFLCVDDVSKDQLDAITTGTMLWTSLQNCDKLGPNNLGFIQSIFKDINRSHLLKDLLSSCGNRESSLSYESVDNGITGNCSVPVQENVMGGNGHYTETNCGIADQTSAEQASYPPQFNDAPVANGGTHAHALPHQESYTHDHYQPPPEPPTYLMDSSPHGLCVIINNFSFCDGTTRSGAGIDEARLEELFGSLGYTVIIRQNLTRLQMEDCLATIAEKEEQKKADSFVCCILTHGAKDTLLGTDRQEVDIDYLVSPFKGARCPSLADKPKMFFIQCCRGDVDDSAVEVHERDGFECMPKRSYTLPSEADFFFGFATTRGCTALRSKKNGSWYITHLHDVLCRYACYRCDLLTMHTMVNQQVSEMSALENEQLLKQCSAPVNTLRKRVVFL